MPGLEDLYREIILDHYRSPRNRGELPVPPAHVETGFNPLCGDEITVYIQLDGDRIADIRLEGQGCSISQSSASMMSTAVKGRTVTEARGVIRTFKGMMSVHEHRLDGSPADVPEPEVPLGDLEALQGVVKFPVRIKCATLAWNTLTQAIDAAAVSEPAPAPPAASVRSAESPSPESPSPESRSPESQSPAPQSAASGASGPTGA